VALRAIMPWDRAQPSYANIGSNRLFQETSHL
jgi:hypothetical protein